MVLFPIHKMMDIHSQHVLDTFRGQGGLASSWLCWGFLSSRGISIIWASIKSIFSEVGLADLRGNI